ncbi:hypothetical protein VaNZ11_007732 [Volvox africanus]|uniref:gamma-glutamylcyclotransferase n=1 Tax=Volvox africanus TaxID=51714 RepID=A0ABQ5S4G9_9CHLO|nr:hypothetical protein VaNZ11_007732 [Volvox africanus]
MQGQCNSIQRASHQRTGLGKKCYAVILHMQTGISVSAKRFLCNGMGRCNLKRGCASPHSSLSNVAQTVQPQVPESCLGTDGIWYFAYGSNMNPNTLTGRRKVVPRESRPASLRGWKLSFRMLGIPFLEPGFATVERVDNIDGGNPPQLAPLAPAGLSSPSDSTMPLLNSSNRWGSEVHGVLHRISLNDWIQIMTTEGVGAGKSGYRVVEVEVTQYDGRRVRALTLEGQAPSMHSAARPVSPSRRYLGLLRDGARHYGLDPEYVTYLDSLNPYEGDGWNAAMGRAISLAVVVPLALPLLPPFFLRMAGNKARDAAQQAKGVGGNGTEPSTTLAGCTSVADCVEAAAKGVTASSRDSADVGIGDSAMTATTPTPTGSFRVTAPIRGSVPTSSNGDLPSQLLRPPLVLPEVASGYLRAIQYVTWAVHDILAAPLLGNGSSAAGNGNSNGKL